MKKFLMILCCILSFGFVLAGCSTVSMVTNDNSELIYNGNAGVTIGDYLYFGNAYNEVSSLTDLAGLRDVRKSSYLARINLENVDAKGQNFTPNGVEKVNSEAIANENQFMFAIGNYIYYLKPDIHRYTNEEGASYQFNYSVLCSVKLNGDGNREIYTYQGEVNEIEVLKYDGNYYVVAYAGESLFVTRLNNGRGSTKILGERVTSVAIPSTKGAELDGYTDEWNGMIYFTDSDENSVSRVKEIAVTASDAEEAMVVGDKNGTVSFVYRQNDLIFYTYTSGSITRTYYNNVKDLSGEFYRNNIILVDNAHEFSTATISNVFVIQYGTSLETVIYTANESIYYKNTMNGSGEVSISDAEGTDLSSATIMVVDDRLAYLITSTGIYEVDFARLALGNGDISLTATKTLATMTSINTGVYSYDGDYIYFYAGLEALTDEEQELIDKEKEEAGIEVSDEEEDITSLDSGVYLYRVSISTGATQLLGVTNYEERHSSYVYRS